VTTPASTTARLLRLLSLLQTRRDWPGTLLAQRLEVSPRTVRRDVDRLRDLGYAIGATMGPDGGYRLEAGTELPPLLFDDDQALALTIALQTATALGVGGVVEEAAVRALTTMRQLLPAHLRHRLDALEVTTVTNGAGEGRQYPVAPHVLIALSAAIRAREVLRFDYAGRGAPADVEGRPPRRVEPHHLATWQGRWYLVAWDLERDGWRLFRADRIAPRTPTGPRFTPRQLPGGDVQEFVAARFKGSDVDAWPCTGTVILGLPASRVRPFAGDGIVCELGTDRCSLEAGSWSWESLAASFGLFEAEMEVVGPPELAAAFRVLARRYAATGNVS
jgi:predicted DNA-binding transcriptional regulator YafY